MPAERSKKPKTPEDVPDPGDPDRKRVLNVLAQRRYRQRRREKIAELEAKAKELTPPSFPQPHQGGVELDNDKTSASPPDVIYESHRDFGVEEIVRGRDDVDFADFGFNQDQMDFALFPDFGFSNLPSPNPSSPDLSLQPSTTSSSNSPPLAFNFPLTPDGAQLDIPVLSVMRAFGVIATALDVLSHIYDPFYKHVLPPTPHPALPPNLHPTPAQISIPHHPLLDTLPWPSVREKLICVFSLPPQLRPPIARDDGLVRVAHDLDDSKDGLRVHGCSTTLGEGNELVEEAWEVGELFYRNWWWCLDTRVIDISNRRRRERGLGALRIEELKS